MTETIPESAKLNFGGWRDALLCVLASLIVYFSALGNGFTYDDKIIVEQNERIRSLDQIPQVWQSHWWLDPNVDDSFGVHRLGDRLYRPLSMTSFSLNYAISGLEPFAFILTNVLLHGLVTLLVWQFARALLKDRWLALSSGLLFAVHPVHAEVVANSVGRAELLAALFMLCSGLCLLGQQQPGWKAGIVAALFGLLALFSKESAICMAPVLGCLLIYRKRMEGWTTSPGWWGMQLGLAALPAVIYLPIRFFALGGTLVRLGDTDFVMNPLQDASMLGKLTGVLSIAGHYTRLLLLPVDLSSDYSYAVITHEPVFTGMTLLGGLSVLAMLCCLGGWLRTSPLMLKVATLSSMFLASYVLISNAVIHIGVTLAERLMYWPSVPAVLLISVLAVELYRQMASAPTAKPGLLGLVKVAGIALVIALGLRSAVRAPEWTSDAVLFPIDAETQPQSALLASRAAQMLYSEIAAYEDQSVRRILLQEATRHADRALEIFPSLPDAMYTRAVIYLTEGDREKALAYLEAAAQVKFSDPKIRALLERVRDPGRGERIKELKSALEENPDDIEASLTYGEALLGGSDPVPALKFATQLAAKHSQSMRAHWLKARAALASVEPELATVALRQVIAMEDSHWQAHTNLSFTLIGDQPEQALHHATRAVEIAPLELEAQYNYAIVLMAVGRDEEAILKLEEVLASPDFPRDHPLYAVIRERFEDLKKQR